MTLLLLRAGILAQARGAAPPPAPDLYVPPSPDGIALDFALDATGTPYVAPESDAVMLQFAPVALPPPPGVYDPPPSDSVTLAFIATGGAYLPPPATAIPLEF